MDRLEIGAATALAGAAVFSIHSVYTTHAGDLSEARQAPPKDPATMQRICDADILTGGLVILAGGALGLATGKVYPFLLAALAFLLVACYYHAALAGSSGTATPPPEGVTSDTGY